ncbi:pentatricopeptide repeat-containing protein At3g26540 [Aristolochia californica]|uniref:pentatricopeptide repeat-containing protein At3g26540 n=1 Tax=Aristolochia californica TaxID=171875 RepID=UPI0035D6DA1E
MGVTAASLLDRLIQKTQKPKSFPKAAIKTIISQLDSGQLKKAVSLLCSSPFGFPSYLYARLLSVCASKGGLVEARKIESHLVQFLPEHPVFLLNRSIETYAKCGSLRDARELFDEMPRRDGGSWNAMITAYAQAGESDEALLLFSIMNSSRVFPNEITFASVLGCCADLLALSLARQVHGLVLKFGFYWNVILGSALVDIYGKCRIIHEARRMFDEIPSPNSVSWNVIVRRYLEMGKGDEAVMMFFQMIRENVQPLKFTLSSVLIACAGICAIHEGSQIHGFTIKTGFEEEDVVTTSLIDMYLKCGCLEDAHLIFDQPNSRNVVSWTSMVSGYAMSGVLDKARELFNEMSERNIISWNAMLAGYIRFSCWEQALDFVFWMCQTAKDFDHVTLGLILNVCAGLLDLKTGKEVHGFAYRHGFFSNLLIGNALLDMYGKCGSLRSADQCFLEMDFLRDRISWNALITGYARHGRSEEALQIFREMQYETTPDEFTFSTISAACANIFTLAQGKEIHGYMIRNAFKSDLVIRGALVDMYSKCRCPDYAIKVFEESGPRDIILWNSLLLGCAHNGMGSYVLDQFCLMQEEGIKPDNVTFLGVLLACIGEGFVELGQDYFDSISSQHCVIPRLEHYECMIELLGKHGYIDDLEIFIHEMPFEPTVAMWTRVFDCCREYGHSRLGRRAEKCLNELNPSNPIRFELSEGNDLNPS